MKYEVSHLKVLEAEPIRICVDAPYEEPLDICVDAPYEEPLDPNLVIDSLSEGLGDSVLRVINLLNESVRNRC